MRSNQTDLYGPGERDVESLHKAVNEAFAEINSIAGLDALAQNDRNYRAALRAKQILFDAMPRKKRRSA